MHKKILFSVFLFAWSMVSTVPAFAQKSWNQTGGGTLNWGTSGNWTPSGVPGVADSTRITNDLASSQMITNARGTINFLAISNGVGAATIKAITGAGLTNNFGLQLGRNATLEIAHNSSFGTNINVTFDLRAGGQPGTLVITNGAVLFLNSAGQKGLNNSGTIQLTASAGQNSQINYGQISAFTNSANGTIVKTGTGTGSFIGNFGSGNRAFINDGTFIVSGGTVRMDPRDAFSRGGFQNSATGFVQVDSGAVFELRRTANAWANAAAPTNFGTVFMNGGTLLTFDTDGGTPGTNTARSIVNAGLVEGDGNFRASLNNVSGGTVSPGLSLGTLNVAGNVVFGSNSTLSIELSLVDGQSDLLAVGGNVTLSSFSQLDISGGVAGNVYTVMTFSAVSGTFGDVTPDYILTYNLDNLTIELVPEPSTLALVGVGLAGMVALRIRKRRYGNSRTR